MIARRGEQTRAEHHRRSDDAIGVEVPIPDRCAGAAVFGDDPGIERETHEADGEQADTDVAQTGMRDRVEQREQRDAFNRPADGEPLAFELDRENESNEEQRYAAEERKQGVARGAFDRSCSDQAPEAGKARNREQRRDYAFVGECRPGHVHDAVDQEEVQRQRERRNGPNCGALFKMLLEDEWEHKEEHSEAGMPCESGRGGLRMKAREMPRVFEHEHGEQCRASERVDSGPAHETQHDDHEQRSEPEDWRGIRHRQAKEHERQQHEGRDGAEGTDLREDAGGFGVLDRDFPRGECRSDDEENRERADQHHQAGNFGKRWRDFENPAGRNQSCKHQHSHDREQRTGEDRQCDRKDVQPENHRPKRPGDLRQFAERQQDEQERK